MLRALRFGTQANRTSIFVLLCSFGTQTNRTSSFVLYGSASDKRCQACIICEENQRMNPEEPPVQEHDLAAYAMEFLGSDLFYFDGDTWLIVVDFYSGFPLVKNPERDHGSLH